MKRPKLKKASKRISCSVKYKIQKKVKEHHKKLRKEAKKKGVNTRPKKDLGVPNIAPFKEEVLREAEQRRLKIEEEKEKKKQAKKEKRKENKRKGKDSDLKDEPKAKKARTDEKNEKKKYKKIADKSSKKSLCSELNKVIDASDVILEVLDARDPLGYRCPQLEEAVLRREGSKKLLFVLTKIDLVPKENLERWIQCLQQEFPVLAFKAAIQLQDRTVNERKNRILASNGVFDKSRAASCLGNEVLLELLEGHLATMDNKEGMLKVGVVGFPNVGKSSLINSVKGVRACNAGVQRGITKTMQDVHISKSVKLLDSPGVVAAPSNPPVSMALRSLQVEDGQDSTAEAVRTLLKQCDKNQIMLQYNIADFRNHLEFLSLFAKKRGYLLKGGVLNMEQAAAAFLNDWTGAKLSYHCKAPESCSPAPYLSEAVVAEMQKGWDLDRLKRANEETLREVRCPNKASSIVFVTKGPSAGLLSVADVPEDKPARVPTKEDEDSGPKKDEEEPVMKNEGLEDVMERPEEEQTEEVQETSVKDEPTTVQQLQTASSVDASLPTASAEASLPTAPVEARLPTDNDDAYDFSTDFK